MAVEGVRDTYTRGLDPSRVELPLNWYRSAQIDTMLQEGHSPVVYLEKGEVPRKGRWGTRVPDLT